VSFWWLLVAEGTSDAGKWSGGMSGWANHTLSPSARRQLDTQNKAANCKAPLHPKTVTATAKLTSDNGQKLNHSS